MAKLMILMIAFAFIAVVSAVGGVKDLAGNYYDLTTGQYSSSLTGRVYNTAYSAPAVVAAAPYIGHYGSPYAAYGAPYGYASYAAPLPYSYGLYK